MNKHKTVFLDRDGVINKNKDNYVKVVKDFEILQGVGESIKKLKENGFLIIIITNQSAINRGLTTKYNVDKIHKMFHRYLKKFQTKVDSIYICPHRPDENCLCRKPKTGLFLQASTEWNVDLNRSWMVGDSETDMIAGQRFGCKCKKVDKKNSFAKIVDSIIFESKLLEK